MALPSKAIVSSAMRLVSTNALQPDPPGEAAKRAAEISAKIKFAGFNFSDKGLILIHQQQGVGKVSVTDVVRPISMAALPGKPTGH